MILRAAGVNCERETAHAWELAGAQVQILHINRLREQPDLLKSFQILTIPGGFSYGDDIAAGRIFAGELTTFLGDQLRDFAERGGLILGICNGFQVLCKAGLLPAGVSGLDLPRVSIAANVSAKYEDRWVRLIRSSDHCVFLRHQSEYELPVAHGEGRVMTREPADMQRLVQEGYAALQYVSRDGGPVQYPDNPNGSQMDVAGLCDPTGCIFGLMPHPERFVEPTQHPAWTSRSDTPPDGILLFQSAVCYFK